MRHIGKVTSERPVLAEKGSDTVCGYLFTPNYTKCVSSDSPVARLLKGVPVP